MKPVYRSLLPILLAATALVLSACGKTDSPSTAPAGAAAPEESAVSTIEGEVFYRERMLLPPGVQVEVQLQDISRADAPAAVMATVMLTPEGGPPWPFSISYNPAEIDSRMRYALRATVSREGQLLFTSTDYIDPFAGNPVQIMVRRVGEPVRPAAEAGAGAPAVSDGPAAWVLATLGGEPAATGAGGRPVDLVLNEEAKSVAGFSGCNQYSGGYQSEGESSHGTPIAFGQLASTMRACMDGGELEQAYLKMLSTVDAYRMEGDELALLAGDSVVATFRLQ